MNKGVVSKGLILLGILFMMFTSAKGQDEEAKMLDESSRLCANCHGNHYYTFHNTYTEMDTRKRMNPYFFIDTTKYVEAIHSFFACQDCHSSEYETYPHPSELKLEPKFGCIDCHGGDETFAKYQFDDIEVEVDNSVHKLAHMDQFKCEMCHDLHSYKLTARDENSSIKEIVVENNQMCLSCHNNLSKYQILTDHEKPELLKTHDWLPNQELHFLSVRCIECHTPTSDTLMVSHKILPKEQAVHLCSDCHSTNSILRTKLYKYHAEESRVDQGYYNAVILNEAYVIGANRNRYLNLLSLMFFGLALSGIGVHIVARIIKKK
jgi:hypothetical protein